MIATGSTACETSAVPASRWLWTRTRWYPASRACPPVTASTRCDSSRASPTQAPHTTAATCARRSDCSFSWSRRNSVCANSGSS